MSIDCKAAAARLPLLLDGELEERLAVPLRLHLGGCLVCRHALETYRRDEAMLRQFLASAPTLPVRAPQFGRSFAWQPSRGRALALAAQVVVVLAALGALLLVLRAVRPETTSIPATARAVDSPVAIAEEFIAARADHDLTRARSLVDDHAVVFMANGHRINVATLQFDTEFTHLLVREDQQMLAGTVQVDGTIVSWREHVIQDTPRLPGVPPLEFDQDVQVVVEGGKIVSLTFTPAPAGS